LKDGAQDVGLRDLFGRDCGRELTNQPSRRGLAALLHRSQLFGYTPIFFLLPTRHRLFDAQVLTQHLAKLVGSLDTAVQSPCAAPGKATVEHPLEASTVTATTGDSNELPKSPSSRYPGRSAKNRTYRAAEATT
jgi:hypothetical protein